MQWVMVLAVLAAVASCKSSSSARPGTSDGGTTSTGDGGTPGSSITCAPGQTHQGDICVDVAVTGQGAPCGTGGACTSGVCVQGVCAAADGSCSFVPPKGPFTPRVAWQWTGSTNHPEYADVLMTPVVVPLRATTTDVFTPPAVVFSTILGNQGAGAQVAGIVRAVSGRDGTDIWATDPAYPVNGLSNLAAADLDGDGRTEIVTGRFPTQFQPGDTKKQLPPLDDGLIAFDADGKFLWEVKGLKLYGATSQRVYWGAPSIANLYGGKESQVIIGATVIDAHGKIVCQGTEGQGDNWLGPISAVADVDLDGSPDIVTGNTIYDNHCNPKPGWPNGQPDGLVAVANFTGDAHPEIVVVSGGAVRLQDWQGHVVWGPVTIPGITDGKGGGAPTIADFDGDGQLEIGVAGASTYTVFKPFAANPILWSNPTQDQSRVTGSSVFDFQREGRAQVVYGDECYTRVYDGPSGDKLFEAPNPSCTVHENPVIADVDRDGRAELVVATNSVCSIQCPWGNHTGSGKHGITVFKDLRDHWVSTRSIWNQHAYHVTNINDDGSVPVQEANNWTATWSGQPLNNYRMNSMGNVDYRAPDLAASVGDARVNASSCPAKISVSVDVWNRGAVLVTAGVPVALYSGQVGGPLLGVAHTTGAIVPGAAETVSLDIAPAPSVPTDLVVSLNDDGTGQGVVGECGGKTNNAVILPKQYCPAVSR